MKKATVNDYFRHHWMKLMLFALFTAAVSFFAPLKNFQLKWLIDSRSKQQLRDIDRQSLYQRVGYIAQTTYLFNDTLRSNICLGADFPEAQLSHAIGTAGLADWVSTLPDGLDTLISENGKNLSGGQRQRIGIARLALRRYDLIIADEITASLDPDTSGQVMENLLALPCMVVAITHDVSGAFMKQFDKVYRVEHGSVTPA